MADGGGGGAFPLSSTAGDSFRWLAVSVCILFWVAVEFDLLGFSGRIVEFVLQTTYSFLSVTRVFVCFCQSFSSPRGIEGNLCVFSSVENLRFDAAQYTFFSNAPLEELELGGLVDDGVDAYGGRFGVHEAYRLSPVGEEVRLSLSDFVSRKAGFLFAINCVHCMISEVLLLLVLATVLCIQCSIQSSFRRCVLRSG